MPKKRTKDQKLHARHLAVTAPAAVFTDSPTKKAAPTANSLESLYAYDPVYLHRDLRKTLIISLLILAMQLGLYVWLR